MIKKGTKRTVKSAGGKQERAKVSVQEVKDTEDKVAVEEYGQKYDACQVIASKVMAARELMELAGGYKEAFILMDAVNFATEFKPKVAEQEAEAEVNDADEKDFEEEYEANATIARKVLAADRLLKLAGGYNPAFTLLDAVMVEMEGPQGRQQAANVRHSAAGHHKLLAAAAEKTNGK
jgi:hypothetical protein